MIPRVLLTPIFTTLWRRKETVSRRSWEGISATSDFLIALFTSTPNQLAKIVFSHVPIHHWSRSTLMLLFGRSLKYLLISSRGWICEHPAGKMKSRESIVPEVYMIWSPVRRFPLRAELLWSIPNVRTDHGQFVSVINVLIAPIGNEFSNHPLELVVQRRVVFPLMRPQTGSKGEQTETEV